MIKAMEAIVKYYPLIMIACLLIGFFWGRFIRFVLDKAEDELPYRDRPTDKEYLDSIKEPTEFLTKHLPVTFVPLEFRDRIAEILRDYACEKVTPYREALKLEQQVNATECKRSESLDHDNGVLLETMEKAMSQFKYGNDQTGIDMIEAALNQLTKNQPTNG